MNTPELLSTLALVRAALVEAGVPHVFIGALPVLAFGRPRATTDRDVVAFCDAEALSRLDQALRQRQLVRGADVRSPDDPDPLPDIAIFWTPSRPTVRVDVFIAKMEFEDAVRRSARDSVVAELPLLLASPEASIIYTLIASRPKDLADVESIFEARAAAGEQLDWEFLDAWSKAWAIEDRLAPFAARFRT